MIDFYKFNFLSVLGKDAGNMDNIEYQKKIVKINEEYLLKLKELKKSKE